MRPSVEVRRKVVHPPPLKETESSLRHPRTVPSDERAVVHLEERAGLTPYIDIADEAGRHCIAVVSPEMVRMTERCRDSWIELQAWSRGGAPQPPSEQDATPPRKPPPARPRAEPQAQEALRDRLLELIGFATDEELFSGSLREFVDHRRAEAAPGETDD